MKQFLINFFSLFYVPRSLTMLDREVRRIMQKQKASPGVYVAESKKQMRKRRLLEMYQATGLDYVKSSELASRYGITIPELVDYYHYFGGLPKEDYKIILRNYGVQALISECQTLIEL